LAYIWIVLGQFVFGAAQAQDGTRAAIFKIVRCGNDY